jgi:hypothetical protein
MAELWFQPKVPVRTPEGHRYNVGSVQAAAETLLSWPDSGPLWQAAVKSCFDALSLEVPPEETRDAFRLAAEEAGKLLPEISER